MTAIDLAPEGEKPEEGIPASAETTTYLRIKAFLKDTAPRVCVAMTPEAWVLATKISLREAQKRPPAIGIKYGNGAGLRIVFDHPVKLKEDGRTRLTTGIWASAPTPLIPALARPACANPNVRLYATDREDIAIALAASGQAVFAVAPGASLFANAETVDDVTPDEPRPLHPACTGLVFGSRELAVIASTRDAALALARGLRRGGVHTGAVTYIDTQRFLAELDNVLARDTSDEQRLESTEEIGDKAATDVTHNVSHGSAGSVGARVPVHLLEGLPDWLTNLKFPTGDGASWDDLSWAMDGDSVRGIYVESRGEEALTRALPTLSAPVWITHIYTGVDPQGQPLSRLEVMWNEKRTNENESEVWYETRSCHIDRDVLLSQSPKGLLSREIPITDHKGGRPAQWFHAFFEQNGAKIPRSTLHSSAGWVTDREGNLRFLSRLTTVPGHVLDEEVLTGVNVEGSEEEHWELTRAMYNACEPTGQLLFLNAHASILCAALKVSGVMLGIMDAAGKGKTVIFRTAARQYGWGGGDYAIDCSIPPTPAYAERILSRCNGIPMFFDEFDKLPNTEKESKSGSKQVSQQELMYLLSNGARRGRANGTGGIDAPMTRVYCCGALTGELTGMSAIARAAQKSGAQVRMISLPHEGFSEAFLTTWPFQEFMSRMEGVRGHIGRRAIIAFEAALQEHGRDGLLQQYNALTKQLIEWVQNRFGSHPNLDRRARMLSIVLHTELLLAEYVPGNGMWANDFENTAVIRALSGSYGQLLVDPEALRKEKSGEAPSDEMSVSNILLEEIARDPTCIKGLVDTEYMRANPHPIGAIVTGHTRKDYITLRFYPEAVYKLLKSNNIPRDAARQLMLNSGDFVKHEKNGNVSLLYKSCGQNWILPVAGWGWDVLQGTFGDEKAAATDPNYAARQKFVAAFDEAHGAQPDVMAALVEAIRATLREAAQMPPGRGTIYDRLVAHDARMWSALVLPLAQMLLPKDNTPEAELQALLEWGGVQALVQRATRDDKTP